MARIVSVARVSARIKRSLSKNWHIYAYFLVMVLFIVGLVALIILGSHNPKTIVEGIAYTAGTNTVTFSSGEYHITSDGTIRTTATTWNDPDHFYDSIANHGGLEDKNIVINSGAKVYLNGSHNIQSLLVQGDGLLSHDEANYSGEVSKYPTDRFTARWTGYLFEENLYDLSTKYVVKANNGAKISIRNIGTDEEWCNPATSQSWTTSATETNDTEVSVSCDIYADYPGEMFKIEIDYLEGIGESSINFYAGHSYSPVVPTLFVNKDMTPGNCGGTQFIGTASAKGLCGEYFMNVPNALTDPFPASSRVGVRIDPTINNKWRFDWGKSGPLTEPSQGLDLDVAGSVTLKDTAMINVTGKGYPGGIIDSLHEFGGGSGNGGGWGGGADEKDWQGGGGGSDGRGGNVNLGTNVGGLAYPSVGDPIKDSDYVLGSGGGGNWINFGSRGKRPKDGGAGGGKVHIKAQTFDIGSTSKIMANGFNTYLEGWVDGKWGHDGGYCSASGGAGAGGTVWLESGVFSFSSGQPVSVQHGSVVTLGTLNYEQNDPPPPDLFNDPPVYNSSYTYQNAADGTKKYFGSLPTPTNIFAYGGSSTHWGCDGSRVSNPGGGGRILINKTVVNYNVVLTKVALDESGIYPVTKIDPGKTYTFKITATLTGGSGSETVPVTITDIYNSSNLTLVPNSFSPSNPNTTTPGQIIWDNVNLTNNGSTELRFKGKVPEIPNCTNKAVNSSVDVKGNNIIKITHPSALMITCGITINGDIYGNGLSLSNAPNLNGVVTFNTGGTGNATYNGTPFQNNIISWDSAKFFADRVDPAISKYALFTSIYYGQWFLDSSIFTSPNPKNSASGGIWKTNDSIIFTATTYYNRGVIIFPVNASLTISQSVKRSNSASNPPDLVGLISYNDLTINMPPSGNLKIDGALIARGLITINNPTINDLTITGMILADNVIIKNTGGGSVTINYDNSLQSRPLPLLDIIIPGIGSEITP